MKCMVWLVVKPKPQFLRIYRIKLVRSLYQYLRVPLRLNKLRTWPYSLLPLRSSWSGLVVKFHMGYYLNLVRWAWQLASAPFYSALLLTLWPLQRCLGLNEFESKNATWVWIKDWVERTLWNVKYWVYFRLWIIFICGDVLTKPGFIVCVVMALFRMVIDENFFKGVLWLVTELTFLLK